jgi:hypothetical protein
LLQRLDELDQGLLTPEEVYRDLSLMCTLCQLTLRGSDDAAGPAELRRRIRREIILLQAAA